MSVQSLFEFLDTQHNFVVNVQKGMTSLPAIGPDNGGEGEARKASFLKQVLQKIGITEIQEINAKDERVPGGLRPNLAVRIPGKSKRTLWVVGHMDVVPPGDLNLWESDPFKVRQDGDILIGRGVEDNQQAIATALLVLRALRECKAKPDLSLGVLFVSDEETHNTYGMDHVVQAAPDLITKDDLVLVPDIGDKMGKTIEIAEKSCLWMKVVVTGKQCHASTPDEGVNALVASSAAILALDELKKLYPKSDPLYQPATSTFVPSKKERNVENINTVPGLDVFYVDCRVLPGISLDDIVKKTQDLVSKAVKPYGAGARVEAIFSASAPAGTPKDAMVVQRLQRSLRKLRGFDGDVFGAGGGTIAAVLRTKGIGAAAWSTIYSNAHSPNEKSSIINTIADAKVVADMLFD